MSPRRWREVRLAAGLAMVALAVILGWQITKGLADRDMAWVAARDLPAGIVLERSDIYEVQVLLGASGNAYHVNTEPPVGEVLEGLVQKGELIPRRQGNLPDDTSARLVTVGVQVDHAPLQLKRGDLVDVWIFIEDETKVDLVLSGVIVGQVDEDSASFGDLAAKRASLLVTFDESKKLVEAGRLGVFDLVLHDGRSNDLGAQ